MNNFKDFKVILTGVIVLTMSAALLTGCAGTSTNKSSNTTATNPSNSTTSVNQSQSSSAVKQTDANGIPSSVKKLLGLNPYTVDTFGNGVPDNVKETPKFKSSPIKESSTNSLPVKVKDARVEDNVNANDHLEIALTNVGKTDLKDFDIYFALTDTVTKAKEGYYVKLVGFTLEAGATKTLHFDNKDGDLSGVLAPLSSTVIDKIQQDNKKGALHYNGNPYGIYGTSKNEVLFQGQVHAAGYASLDFSAKKSKGTAEVAD